MELSLSLPVACAKSNRWGYEKCWFSSSFFLRFFPLGLSVCRARGWAVKKECRTACLPPKSNSLGRSRARMNIYADYSLSGRDAFLLRENSGASGGDVVGWYFFVRGFYWLKLWEYFGFISTLEKIYMVKRYKSALQDNYFRRSFLWHYRKYTYHHRSSNFVNKTSIFLRVTLAFCLLWTWHLVAKLAL